MPNMEWPSGMETTSVPMVPQGPLGYRQPIRKAREPMHRGFGLKDEIILDAKTGRPRQAGTLSENEQFVNHIREQGQKSLYFFAKSILGFDLLTPTLHLPFCQFLQKVPPYRKLTLMPRIHYKTTVAKSLVIHQFIQPDGDNVYYPEGFPHQSKSTGSLTRVLLSSATTDLAKKTLGEITARIESNMKLKAFWPDCFWEEPRRQAPMWNKDGITLPRNEPFKEPSIDTGGVGSTKTGSHYDLQVNDDLIERDARNSPAIMNDAIEWFTASRAFMEDQDVTREFTFGTHWAVNDLYTHIIQNDRSVEPYVRSIVEDGKPILPERFSMETIEQMKQPEPLGYGSLFPLLFMNSVLDPELVDFDTADLRYFALEGGMIHFDDEERDDILHEFLYGGKRESEPMPLLRNGPQRSGYSSDEDRFDAYADYMATRYGP